MTEATKFIRMLKDIVTKATSFPVFVVAGGNATYQIEARPEAVGGNPDGANIILRQGRELALQHPHIRQNNQLLIMQIMPGSTAEGEVVLACMLDEQTRKINAMPFLIARDRKGNITNLIDTGDIVQVAGTFLYAFLIGINTSDQTEEHALQQLDHEMERLGKDFIREVRKRLEP